VNRRPRVAVTLGDPGGIGPEIVARLLRTPVQDADLVVVGSARALLRERERVGDFRLPPPLGDRPAPSGGPWILDLEPEADLPPPGRVDAGSGRLSHAWVLRAVRLAREGVVDALVTGPIHKGAWHLAGVQAPGHTEALQAACGVDRVLMVLVGGRLRAALATIHVPLREVPERIQEDDLVEDLRLLSRGVGRDFAVAHPRLAVCGLNPHAGEGGLLGPEDEERILPAVLRARAEGIDAHGPLPADACIPQASAGAFDAVLAMYHDQALPAVKTLAPRTAVNLTLGLPFVRTSVDHGTALDIAGRGMARESSLRAAVEQAIACAAARSIRGVPPPT